MVLQLTGPVPYSLQVASAIPIANHFSTMASVYSGSAYRRCHRLYHFSIIFLSLVRWAKSVEKLIVVFNTIIHNTPECPQLFQGCLNLCYKTPPRGLIFMHAHFLMIAQMFAVLFATLIPHSAQKWIRGICKPFVFEYVQTVLC